MAESDLAAIYFKVPGVGLNLLFFPERDISRNEQWGVQAGDAMKLHSLARVKALTQGHYINVYT